MVFKIKQYELNYKFLFETEFYSLQQGENFLNLFTNLDNLNNSELYHNNKENQKYYKKIIMIEQMLAAYLMVLEPKLSNNSSKNNNNNNKNKLKLMKSKIQLIMDETTKLKKLKEINDKNKKDLITKELAVDWRKKAKKATNNKITKFKKSGCKKLLSYVNNDLGIRIYSSRGPETPMPDGVNNNPNYKNTTYDNCFPLLVNKLNVRLYIVFGGSDDKSLQTEKEKWKEHCISKGNNNYKNCQFKSIIIEDYEAPSKEQLTDLFQTLDEFDKKKIQKIVCICIVQQV